MSDIHQQNLLVCLNFILYIICLTSINKIYLYIYFVSFTFYVWLPSTKFNCVRILHFQYFMSDIHQRNLCLGIKCSLNDMSLSNTSHGSYLCPYIFHVLYMWIIYLKLNKEKFILHIFLLKLNVKLILHYSLTIHT